MHGTLPTKLTIDKFCHILQSYQWKVSIHW
jgi:hypothetical protein